MTIENIIKPFETLLNNQKKLGMVRPIDIPISIGNKTKRASSN
jgi:hypothetical protein